MLARLVRGCIALAFTACVLAVACSHRLVDAVKGGELSSMALAMEREPTAYRSLLMVVGAVLADPERMLARLVRGCIALSFTARVPADQSSHKGTFVSSVLYNAIQCKSQQTYRKIRYPLK
jgi:type III secretory pathway component EscT